MDNRMFAVQARQFYKFDAAMLVQLSVLMTALFASKGTAPPVYPVPPPRGIMTKSSSIKARTKRRDSASVSG